MEPSDRVLKLLEEHKGYKYTIADLINILKLSHGQLKRALRVLMSRHFIDSVYDSNSRKYFYSEANQG